MTINNFDYTYKNHIQFLRAISVLFVFFYHLKIEMFNKGYLGVDIFFVISGFVITQSIIQNYKISNNFNILNFFYKRFKRIMPNLFFIVTSVYVFYLIFGPPEISLWHDYISSIFGVSNLYYLFSEKGYFYNIFDNPLAHTWSLGVEEQFYLIYPIVLYIFFKFKENFLSKIFATILLLVFTSFVFSVYFFERNPDITFYFSPLRFWELGFGCLCFFLTKYKLNNKYLSFISFFAILFTIFFNVSDNLIINSLLVILFSGLFIISKNNQNFFQKGPLIYLGKISYSFYLWHLPVIFFINIYFYDFTILILLSFIISLLLSSVTFKYIEKFFLLNKNIFSKKYFYYSSIILSISFTFLFYLKYINHEMRYDFRNYLYNLNILEKNFNWINRVKFQNIYIGDKEVHKYCSNNIDDNLVLINNCLKQKNFNYIFFVEGNSHTAQFLNSLNNIEEIENLYFKSASKYFISEELIYKINKKYDRIIYVTDINNSKKIDVIKKSKIFLLENIEFLFFNSTPHFYELDKPAYCISRRIDCFENKSFDYSKRNLLALNKELSNLQKKFSNVNVFNSYNTLCPLDKCKIYDKSNDILYYMDNTHLSTEGSMTLISELRSFIKLNFNLR